MTRDEAMNPEKMSVDELLFLIIALAHNYDGYRKPESLMGLIDEMVGYVKLVRERLTIQSKPDAETRLMLGIESPSQQLANFKKDERTAADALIAGAKAIN